MIANTAARRHPPTAHLRLAGPIPTLLLLILLPALPASAPLGAQQEAESRNPGSSPAATSDSVFGERVEVEVVNVEVFVTDRDGDPVVGLTPEDFRLFEAGEERPISNFYAEVGGRPVGVEPVETAEGERDAGTESGTTAGLDEAAEASRAERHVPGRLSTRELIPVDAVPPPEQRLHLTLFVDQAHIRPSDRERVFRSLDDFLHVLDPSTLISVVSLGSSLTIHSDFLSSRATVESILDELAETTTREEAEQLDRRRLLGEIFRGGTFGRRNVGGAGVAGPELLTQIRAWAENEYHRGRRSLETVGRFLIAQGGVPGRRAFLWISGGVPQRPGEDLFTAWEEAFDPFGNTDYERDLGRFDLIREFEELAERANNARVTLYTLDSVAAPMDRVQGAAFAGRVPSEVLSVVETNYREPQEYTARATGGRRLQAGSRLNEDLTAMARDFRTFYSLGFEPAEEGPEVRAIEVRLAPGVAERLQADPDFAGKPLLRHRESYERHGEDRRAADATLAQLLFGTGDNPLQVELVAGERQRRDDGTLLPLTVRIPVSEVALLPVGEGAELRHTARLAMFVSIQGADGQPRPVQKVPFHAALPEEVLEKARGDAFTYTLPLDLELGDRQVAVAVRDEFAGILSTLRLDLPQSRRRR